MEFLAVSPESVSKAAEILRSGGLAAFPTETVYGLGADARNPDALVKIVEAKGRPRFDPLIVHIASIETLENVANLSLLSEETRKKLFLLAEKFWPGPLSFVLPKSEKIPGIATAGLDTVAVRFPGHETAQQLIELAGGAVAAPSANPFGSISPTRAEHVRDGLGDKVDIILDGGPTRIGVESTVLDITADVIRILRPGGTPKNAIADLVGGKVEVWEHGAVTSPGQLKSHYAPRKPLTVFNKEDIIKQPYEPGAAFLFFDGATKEAWLEKHGAQNAIARVLSEKASVSEAAACLFETLYELDKSGFSRIFAQFAPAEGIGEAINDRLTRAAG
jgi:L-threonylcarbamoyladenylate synthase